VRIHLDPLGGIAGDMFIAAILDAFPDLTEGLLATLRALEMPSGIGIAVHAHRDGTFAGRRFAVTGVEAVSQATRQHGEASGHHHHHHHTTDAAPDAPAGHHHHRAFRDIRSWLDRAALANTVRQHTLGIFSLLADAEAKVHGVTPDEVTFHEVGAWDSIIDIVGAAHLIDTLKADRWSISALPAGSGRVPSAHGLLPVPAPATVLLLQGFPVFDDGVAGERVTPTGAAIVRYLVHNAAERTEASTLMCSGTGFGTRIMPGISNILRAIAFEPAAPVTNEESLAVIEFEIDDQTPEDLALALERLRQLPGVRDVLQMAACGKKGRTVTSIRILADPGAMAHLTHACFKETTTLGIRTAVTRRISLERSHAVADVDGQAIGIKLARRPDGSITAKAEASDLQRAGDRRTRETLRLQAEQQALRREPPDQNGDTDE
jgi:uncharacterized protein (TIGR00299 family) protein